MSRKSLLWVIPVALACLLTAGVLALPGFVASGYHRDTIEALASSLTGRNVQIGGKLSLALLPEPLLTAKDITISGPDHEAVTAQSLMLDIAPWPLLRGQLSARSLTLQSPRIVLPWPLPGGVAAVAPPPWLATLHAQINDGQISLGALTFQHVSADIFTGANGALAVSGTGELYHQPLTLSLGLGATSIAGEAPLTIDANSASNTLHFSGGFNTGSEATGTISLGIASLATLNPALNQVLTATAQVKADAAQITISNLLASQGSARLSGMLTLNFVTPAMSAELSGSNLVIPAATGTLHTSLPLHLALKARNSTLGGVAIPEMSLTADLAAYGVPQASLHAALAGDTVLDASGKQDSSGQWAGQMQVNTTGLNGLFTALGGKFALPDDLQAASFTSSFDGDSNLFRLTPLTGTIGLARVNGALVIAPRNGICGHLHFSQLDITPLLTAARGPMLSGAMNADIELSADHASLYGIAMTHLLLDADVQQQLVIRRFTASVYGGMAAGSFTIAPGWQVTAARGVLAVPSATPLTALLPASWQPPKAVTDAPLAVSSVAAGPANALATSATATLGDFTLTTATVLDVSHQSATGALTLRHPSAIAAFMAFGLESGLAWPGAGSIALRASLSYSPTQWGLPDVVLSMGGLTANGKIMLSPDSGVQAELDADTLALPPWPDDITPLWAYLATAKGKISFLANRVLVAGADVFGPSTGAITLKPNNAAFTLGQAKLGGGVLTGNLTATTAASTPPNLAATFSLSGADASTLSLPVEFPLTMPSGVLAAQGNLTASGYNPKAWAATLSGTLGTSATTGSIAGFDLHAITAALARTPRKLALTKAAQSGVTPFTSLAISGKFDHGIFALAASNLQSPDGSATASGNIDVPDQDISLNLSLSPNVPSPPRLHLSIVGNWAAPKKIPAVKAGIEWKPSS